MDAILALEDGRVFRGKSLGAGGSVTGEVVFNTGMTGYQEILTDPSYRGQIVTLTVPHVGNTGVNEDDPESTRVQARGLIVRAASETTSSWRSERDLSHYMRRHDIVGIEGLDTRALTRHLREAGVLRGCISADGCSEEEAIERARKAPRLEELDLVSEVTCTEPHEWRRGREILGGAPVERGGQGRRVVAIDYGVKHNILRLLADTGFGVTVVPASTSSEEVLALRPDGVFLSNGPGDPAVCADAVQTIGELVSEVPIFGICLGHQLLCRALGASTFKLKFGHRGVNHPVRELAGGTVAITSQNHGYAVDPESLPAELEVTHVSLYDGTVEGVRHRSLPVFSVQFHPEAAPGPHDSWRLFERFAALIDGGQPPVSAASGRA